MESAHVKTLPSTCLLKRELLKASLLVKKKEKEGSNCRHVDSLRRRRFSVLNICDFILPPSSFSKEREKTSLFILFVYFTRC